jgi:hypothetical protein
MHSLHMLAAGPMTSFFTSSWGLLQKVHFIFGMQISVGLKTPQGP